MERWPMMRRRVEQKITDARRWWLLVLYAVSISSTNSLLAVRRLSRFYARCVFWNGWFVARIRVHIKNHVMRHVIMSGTGATFLFVTTWHVRAFSRAPILPMVWWWLPHYWHHTFRYIQCIEEKILNKIYIKHRIVPSRFYVELQLC